MRKDFKKYFFLLLSLVIVFPLFIFFTKPQVEKIKENEKILKEGKEKLAVLRQKRDLLAGLNNEGLSQWVKKINFILPSEKNIDSLLFTLDRISSEASVSVESVAFSPGVLEKKKQEGKTPTPVRSAENKNSLEIVLLVDGRIENLELFLKKLKEDFQAVKIKKLNMSFPVIKDERNISTAEIVIETYYKAASLTLGAISEPIVPLTKKEEKLLEEINLVRLPEEVTPLIVPRPADSNPFFSTYD